jgi:uncharacterized protein (TIGR04255 family)
MDRSTIERHDFKHTFLDKGILRLDYSGVINLEDTIDYLTDELQEAGFTEFIDGYISDFSIKLSDPIQIETLRSIPVEEFAKNKSYKFTNPANNSVIEITKFFTTLTIDYSKFIRFETYKTLFTAIIKNIESHNSYIKPLRIAERKFNLLFVIDENKINEYFESPYFRNSFQTCSQLFQSSNLLTHRAIDTLTVENNNINITRNISKGSLRNQEGDVKEASRLVLDVDCYSIGDSNLSGLLNEDNIGEKLDELNTLSFEIYKQTLTENFIEELLVDTHSNDNIIGVHHV